MNIFSDPKRTLKPLQPDPPGTRIAGKVLLVSLLAGSGLVVWWTIAEMGAARVNAAAEARAAGASIELQLQQAATAVEILAATSQQTGGVIPNFQTMAQRLLASRPAIASIELQPGGVVTEVVPRAGNEMAIGVNVLKDPIQQAAAAAAIRKEAPAILSPALLYGNQPGIVARAATFQKGRDGRETFRGLVAASLRLKEMAGRAQLNNLSSRGYNYSLFVPGAPNRSSVGLLLSGDVFLDGAVQQPLKVHNLNLTLAVQPRAGWINWMRLGLEVSLMVIVCVVLWLGARLLESKRAMTLEMQEIQRRAEQRSKDAAQAEEECRNALQQAARKEAELKEMQVSLKQADSVHADSRSQLEARMLGAERDLKSAQASALAAERSVSNLQDQLAAANRAGQEAAKAHGLAQDHLHAQLRKANAQLAEMQRRLDDLGRAHQEALAANLKEVAASLEEIAQLKKQLEASERATGKSSQTLEKKVSVLEERNRELSALLDEAQAHLEAASRLPSGLPTREAPEASAKSGSETIEHSVKVSSQVPDQAVPEEPPMSDGPSEKAAEVEPIGGEENGDTHPGGSELTQKPDPQKVRSADTAQIPKPRKRKKNRRDQQMDLFGSSDSVDDPTERRGVVAVVVDKDVAEAWPIEPEQETIKVATSPPETTPSTEKHAANTGESGAEIDFPQVKGLSVSEGLEWANGDRKIYHQALREFVQQHGATANRIRAGLEEGDATSAEQLARTLKRSAGEIGAVGLAEAATTLARAIHDRAEPADLEAGWSELESQLHNLLVELKTLTKTKEDRAVPARRLPSAPPLDLAHLRKAVGLILPLLADCDPGAKDCLRDNRNTFRSGFTPEGYADFEQLVKKGDFGEALEALKKAARKHGISV